MQKFLLAAFFAIFFTSTAMAQETASAELAYYSIDNIVLFVSAVLVIFMQAGFAASMNWRVWTRLNTVK